ncbi:hypothetical protein PLANPX_4921 [Lacipirellula parvula]|uniref:ClpX-type ZB domain-containing protein n=1 Tax=Lacipirellula parvula TaxID=2650471 RepID=A0A5K7XPJ3_9BACT|nr:hypothetical protein PLANPX_4921 [Lacipirellula parvula]
MPTTRCDLCRSADQKTKRTPTLLGVRSLCDRCRTVYRHSLAEALVEFQRNSNPSSAAATDATHRQAA